jgi:hypothetical protein
MQSWGIQISLVRNIFTRETACSPGAARLHLSGTYLHGGLLAVPWGSHTSLVRCIFTRRLHAVLGHRDFTCQVHIFHRRLCSPGAARLHLPGTYLHGRLYAVMMRQPDLTCQVHIFHRRLHAVLGQPDLTCQVHIYTGDCMKSRGSQTSLVRYIFTRGTACSPLGQPYFTC